MIAKSIQFLPAGFMPGSTEGKSDRPGTGVAAESQETASEADSEEEQIKLDKSNIILLGPTGCGEC